MGYDLHVTRKEFWSDEEGSEILLDEWIALASSDPELRRNEENPREDNWEMILPEGPWPIWWWCGEVYTKNPQRAAIAKLERIANALGALVQGDDNEIYTWLAESWGYLIHRR